MDKISDKNGLPLWENIRTSKPKSSTGKNIKASKTTIPLSENKKYLSSLLIVENNDNHSNIYTITNQELYQIVHNKNISADIRENILIQFLYFDYLSFGTRQYTNIPADLFPNVKAKKNSNYKEFKISISSIKNPSSITAKQIADYCVMFSSCDGRCHGGCDECPSCISTRCYGGGGSTAPGNFGSSEGSGATGATGAGGSSGSSSSSTPWYLTNPNIDIYQYPSNIRSIFKNLTNYNVILQREQLDYLKNNNAFALKIEALLVNNNLEKSKFTNTIINAYMNNFNVAFYNWSMVFLIQNPNVKMSQFENWFMGTSEGQDGDYYSAYWENPNLTFQKQNLPTFDNFKNACPSKYTNAKTLCNNIGGDILKMYNDVVAKGKSLNTCAIRISKALNYSGITIPSIPNNPNGTKNTVKGADGKNYIISAKALNIWMKKTFGTNSSNYQHYNASEGGNNGINFPNLLKNQKGIYTMVSRLEIQKDWGTGHADLLENGECLLNCHFYDTKNQFVPVDYIDIWILN